MGIERSGRRIAERRIGAVARRLLDASSLCAIATVSARGRAHVNTAYFAWSPELHLVWLSEPRATHSRNLRANAGAAVAVYDSTQSWGRPDRGIQVFGTVRAGGAEADETYAARFPDYRSSDFPAYRLYELVPRRLKLFDERELGAATFITARVAADGTLEWERTEVYRSTDA
jgi:uncharacterized protein YhbP (UPF0306 family)